MTMIDLDQAARAICFWCKMVGDPNAATKVDPPIKVGDKWFHNARAATSGTPECKASALYDLAAK